MDGRKIRRWKGKSGDEKKIQKEHNRACFDDGYNGPSDGISLSEGD